jgi:hypothetical protein
LSLREEESTEVLSHPKTSTSNKRPYKRGVWMERRRERGRKAGSEEGEDIVGCIAKVNPFTP